MNEDGSVRSEPGARIEYNDITYTDDYDMYFGGVCITGLKDNLVFAYGDKRRSNIRWIN